MACNLEICPKIVLVDIFRSLNKSTVEFLK